jgi:hypothetical protein
LVAAATERTQKIDELEITSLLDQNIVRLEISMSAAMQSLEPSP